MDQPLGLAVRVLDLRAYARAYAHVQATKKDEDLQMSPMVQRVLENQARALRERHVR